MITKDIVTNQSDRTDTWGSNRSRPDSPDKHEGCAEDGINYAYKTPNYPRHDNWDILQHHGTYQPQRPPEPSGMTPEPLPYPDPSEATETSSLLPTSLSSPLKKDNIKPDALSMYTERFSLSWNLCLAPVKKNGEVEPAEESEMREGTGLMRGVASLCLEFGGGIGIGVVPPDRMDSEAKPPLSAITSAH